MAIERTLSIIKPDATRRNLSGQINSRFEAAGLRIVAQKRLQLTLEQAQFSHVVLRETIPCVPVKSFLSLCATVPALT